MSHIRTIAPEDAEGDVREMYLRQQGAWGFVPNYARVFCHRPGVMKAWAELLRAVREPMDDELFELVTLAAAEAIGSSYCALAHGRKLVDHYFSDEAVAGMMGGADIECLSDGQRLAMALARKVVSNSSSVTEYDVIELRDYGYDDAQIFDIVATAAARAFIARTVDSLGALPDAYFAEMPPTLQEALCVGRDISTEPTRSID